MVGEKKNQIQQEDQLPALPMHNVYELVDIKDIIEHLRNAVTDKWAYKIPFGDKIARGLGITGAMETAAIIARLSKGQHVIRPLELLKLDETAEAWEATVKAGLYVVGIVNDKPMEMLLNTSIGFHRQPKLGIRKDGSTWVIQVAEKLAVSKAQRKAVEMLIPDKWKQKIIDIAEKEDRIHDETEESDNGKRTQKEATDNQIAAIKARLKSNYVDDVTRAHYETALDKSMTLHEASRAIQTLNKIIETGKAKEAEKGTVKSEQGLFSGSG